MKIESLSDPSGTLAKGHTSNRTIQSLCQECRTPVPILDRLVRANERLSKVAPRTGTVLQQSLVDKKMNNKRTTI
jgi:hypothetical protein